MRDAKFRGLNDAYLDRALSLVRVRGTLSPLFAVMGGAGTLIVLWAGGQEVIAGRLTVGGLVAFNAYLVLLSWPTIALAWIIGIWQRGIAGWARVRDSAGYGAANRVPAAGCGGAAPALGSPSIEVRDLTIEVDGRRLLDGVSFSLPAGGDAGDRRADRRREDDAGRRAGADAGRAARRASSSAGATSPRSRCPRCAGRSGTRRRTRFCSRPRSPRTSASSRPSARRVEAAAEAAGLLPDLAVLPDGYETLVGERGLTLSGGQRQRVALARALAADPRILILDDSLSSVDAQTEREILTRLKPILAGRTSVLISHRLAAVRDADLVLVLERGRVAESGTHASLMAAGGLYATLYRTEQAAEALEGAA